MGELTLLVSIGAVDVDRVEAIASTVRKLVEGSDARVVVAHVLRESDYERTAGRLDGDGRSFSPRLDPITGSFEVPVSMARGGTADIAEPSELSPSAIAERVFGSQPVVRDAVAALDRESVACEIRGAIGDPADRVLAMAEELDADFVLVGGRERSQARKALFGSVSQAIIRSAPCPVISVRNAGGE